MSETEEVESNHKPSQLRDVYDTLEEKSGLNLEQRTVLGHATRLFLDQVEKRTKAQGSKVKGYEWPWTFTPPEFEDEEYAFLTLKLIKRFCADAEPAVTRDLKGSGLIGRLNIMEITSSDIQRLIRGVQNKIETTGNTLWDRFCQQHSLDSQNPEVQNHLKVIESGANRLYASLQESENNPSGVNIVIADVFIDIEKNREALLTPVAV